MGSSRPRTRKGSFRRSIHPASSVADRKYRKNSITSTGTPLSSKGFANSGFVPYETPATMPAT